MGCGWNSSFNGKSENKVMKPKMNKILSKRNLMIFGASFVVLFVGYKVYKKYK